ncbi:MAG: ABC transporter ATP-binding protein [Candidatus Hydrogenedentes bacterium]|nr:ABC transporter ATP-binding protein [Candidatus Hydrogenedentota bacterium]
MGGVSYIEVADLSVAYPDPSAANRHLLAIDRLSLSIPKGAFISIVGPNGCGKTTLLLCLAGILKPTSGNVRIAGVAPGKTTCGYVFQNYRESLYPWLTVLDNIALPLWLDGFARAKARQAATELMATLNIELPVDRFPYTLSGGQQQLAALLRAVIHKPAVLLLDEPLGSLDVPSRADLCDAVQRIWQAIGATTVLVTHDLDEAIQVADTVVAFTPRPARVADTVEVPLPRPRSRDILHDPQVVVWRDRVHRAMTGGRDS